MNIRRWKMNGDGPIGQSTSDHALAMWVPKRTLSLEATHRHTRTVRRMRKVLLALSAGLFLVVSWFFLNVPQGPPMIESADETVTTIHPDYRGLTSDGLPYKITADEAIRHIKDPKKTQLIKPVLHFLRTADVPQSRVRALRGMYDAETRVLELHQNVHLKTDDGTDCKTSHARIFVRGKHIEGDEPINCTGGFGQVSGKAYEINDNYREFVFKNGMTSHLISEKEHTETTQDAQGGPE